MLLMRFAPTKICLRNPKTIPSNPLIQRPDLAKAKGQTKSTSSEATPGPGKVVLHHFLVVCLMLCSGPPRTSDPAVPAAVTALGRWSTAKLLLHVENLVDQKCFSIFALKPLKTLLWTMNENLSKSIFVGDELYEVLGDFVLFVLVLPLQTRGFRQDLSKPKCFRRPSCHQGGLESPEGLTNPKDQRYQGFKQMPQEPHRHPKGHIKPTGHIENPYELNTILNQKPSSNT